MQALCSSTVTNPSRVWLNDGSGTYVDSGQALGPEDLSRQVALGDLDGDGDLDAFAVNFNGPNQVWTNNGDGTFAAGQAIGGAVPHRAAALGDIVCRQRLWDRLS